MQVGGWANERASGWAGGLVGGLVGRTVVLEAVRMHACGDAGRRVEWVGMGSWVGVGERHHQAGCSEHVAAHTGPPPAAREDTCMVQ